MNEIDIDFFKELFQSWQTPLNFLDVDSFMSNHNHINYCECIIAPDGTLSYVSPSHIESLIKVSGKSREEIESMAPIEETLISWLIEFTCYVSIWYEGYMCPSNVTEDQLCTLKKLIENNIILQKEFR